MRTVRPRSHRHLLPALVALVVGLPANAAFHLMKIVEVFPGTAAAPNAQYVVLQMYSSGQNFVQGHPMVFYNAAGTAVHTAEFSGNVSNGASQARILIATAEAQAFFNLSPDLVVSPAVLAPGGKVCFDTIDCVSWGNYSGSTVGVGAPYAASTGLRSGKAARRRLDISGSATVLDAADDTNNSATDFVEASPAPRNNLNQLGTIPGATCGNGAIEGLEECDDGNTANGDSCSSTCVITPAPPTLSIADASIAEGNGGTTQLLFTVSLSALSASPVSFDAATVVGTATPGADFDMKSSTGIVIAAGQPSASFSVTINGDTAVEDHESIAVYLDNASGASIGDGNALGRILNDDNASLSVADVGVVERDSGNSTARFEVSLSAPQPTPVTFDIATSNGTAIAASDYIARTQNGRVLDAGRTTLGFEVAVSGDVAVEGNETFVVTLSNASGAGIADATATGTIIDDDGGSATIPDIQGATALSPLLGKDVATVGVVTARLTGGFTLQARAPGDGLRSVGVFVRSAQAVGRGDVARVRGRVSERIGQTELDASDVRVLESGAALPDVRRLPGAARAPTAAELEALEGMRIAIAAADVLAPSAGDYRGDGQVRNLGRFGIGPARADGAPALFLRPDAAASQAAFDADRGDRVAALTGVLLAVGGEFELVPDAVPDIQARAVPTVARPASDGELALVFLDLARDAKGAVSATWPARGSAADTRRLAKIAHALCVAAGTPDLVVLANLRDRREATAIASALNAAANRLVADACAPASYVAIEHPRAAGLGFLMRGASNAGRTASVQSATSRRGSALLLTLGDAGESLVVGVADAPGAAAAASRRPALLFAPAGARLRRGYRDLLEALPIEQAYTTIRSGVPVAAHRVFASDALSSRLVGEGVEVLRVNAGFSAGYAEDPGLPLRGAEHDPVRVLLAPPAAP